MVADEKMISRIASILLFFSVSAACAGQIREFSIPTLERLGNELTRASQSPDRGASDPARKRAKETAVAALKGKLFDTRYDYVVLTDPGGKRLLSTLSPPRSTLATSSSPATSE